ncbi:MULTISPECIES: type II toxin-antitoxin system RelE/ParE family toxin [Nitrobacter]|nr:MULTISPECIES: type II toxin-antitoxin system RelE/ParE family toxin [Nitrobacter]MCB1392911.1 type II toxin-antitoxin system RelE/ParE family toxin [Nitrobacter sp.]
MKAARKTFEDFPQGAQDDILAALTVAADGSFPGNVKPMKGLGSGVYEVALRHRTDAYRAVYTLQFKDALWVVHAFQKKSKSGIKTPKQETDLILERIKRLKEMLK